ncbi:MAG: hypothetical protein EOM83_10700 [Clostridia bacterium]|jgi:putative membrane protein|nr:hypothetical protein [Clostridia bacterium]
MEIILRFLLSVLIISALLLLLPGIKTTRFYCAIVAAIPITIINMLISPVFASIDVAITALGFGLLIVVMDAVILWLLGLLLRGLKVDGFGWAFVFALILSIIIYFVELVFQPGYFEVIAT